MPRDISRRTALKVGTATALATSIPAAFASDPAAAQTMTTPEPSPHAAWTDPPVVLRVSERVPAGGILTFFGEGFDPILRGNTVHIQPIAGNRVPTGPGPAARELNVIHADSGGHFISVILPQPGPHVAWVGSAHGRSKPVLINSPQPRWLSADESYPGMDVYLCGRNLDAGGYGARGRTEIQLIGDHGRPSARVTVTEISSYHAVFTTPDVPAGVYTVAVRTGPRLPWTVLDDEPLTIVDATATVDPLDLGVAWTRDFPWGTVYEVADYGATGDGVGDDTAAIQSAIRAVGDAGGGVLRFPAGTFNYSGISMRAGVILQGMADGSSVLQYTGTGGFCIGSEADSVTDGRGGLTHLKFTLSPDTTLTSDLNIFWLGQPWGTSPAPGSGRFFFHATEIDMPEDALHLGVACAVVLYDEKILWADNHWKGNAPTPYSPFINNYVTIRDNVFDVVNGDVAIAANRYVAVRNTLTAHFVDGVTGAGGFRGFETAPAHTLNPPAHMYLAGNTVQGFLSDSNSGETFNYEGSGSSVFYDGTVDSAVAMGLTMTLTTPPYAGSVWDGFIWQVLITAGRGLGQLRTITDHSADNTALTIDTAWDVLPDTTSRCVVMRAMRDVVIENNTVVDSAGSCQFYYDAYDSVIAELHSTNTQGSTTLGRILTPRPTEANYFTTIRDSSISGQSAHYQDTSVSALAQQAAAGPALVTCLYGTEILNNTIDRSACSTSSGGRRHPSGIEVAYAEDGITGQGILATLIGGNHISNSQVGIDLNSGTDSTILRNNTFTNATIGVHDDGATNTLTVR